MSFNFLPKIEVPSSCTDFLPWKNPDDLPQASGQGTLHTKQKFYVVRYIQNGSLSPRPIKVLEYLIELKSPLTELSASTNTPPKKLRQWRWVHISEKVTSQRLANIEDFERIHAIASGKDPNRKLLQENRTEQDSNL